MLRALVEVAGEARTADILNEFKCSRNVHVERFLNRSALPNERGDIGMMRIPTDVSRSKSRRLAGPFYDRSEMIQLTPCHLIGQIGRDDRFAGPIPGDRVIDEAMNDIHHAWENVGGKFMRLDCEDAPGLLSLYQRDGFELAQKNSGTGLLELVRFI